MIDLPDLPRQALEEIGLAVGSDVPFCVRGGTCLAEGRGEILTDLPPLPDCAIVLCKPDFGLPTPELFARLDGADLGPRPDTAAIRARPIPASPSDSPMCKPYNPLYVLISLTY